MPQITLEYTQNISPKPDYKNLFINLTELLIELADAKPDACKARAIELDKFNIGLGGENKAFGHLVIRLLSGRDDDCKKNIGEQALNVLKKYFKQTSPDLALQLTVKIEDMPVDFYFKATA